MSYKKLFLIVFLFVFTGCLDTSEDKNTEDLIKFLEKTVTEVCFPKDSYVHFCKDTVNKISVCSFSIRKPNTSDMIVTSIDCAYFDELHKAWLNR